MVLKGFLLAVFALCVSHVVALTLDKSKWIWKDSGFATVDPFVTANFRRHFTSSKGKHATSASILIAGNSKYILYVNGGLVGKGNDWQISQQYCVGLNPTENVFAVADEHLPSGPGIPPNPAAFIAAIQIFYHDGSSDTIATDSKWLAHSSTPDFFRVDFNDASWDKAFVAASANSPPFHIPEDPPIHFQSLCSSSWIWTKEVPPYGPIYEAPIGSRAFRKKFAVPKGEQVGLGVILIDADNEFTLYINGKLIGSGTNWHDKKLFLFTLDPPTSDVTIAVNATNLGGPAGLIATISLRCTTNQLFIADGTWTFDRTVPKWFEQPNLNNPEWPFDVVEGPDDSYVKCTTDRFFVTDDTWKFDLTVPKGFEQPNFNDAKWRSAVIEGPYGILPWRAV